MNFGDHPRHPREQVADWFHQQFTASLLRSSHAAVDHFGAPNSPEDEERLQRALVLASEEFVQGICSVVQFMKEFNGRFTTGDLLIGVALFADRLVADPTSLHSQ